MNFFAKLGIKLQLASINRRIAKLRRLVQTEESRCDRLATKRAEYQRIMDANPANELGMNAQTMVVSIDSAVWASGHVRRRTEAEITQLKAKRVSLEIKLM